MVTTDIPQHLMQLPEEFTPPTKKQVDNNSLPDIASLTTDQLALYNTCVAYLKGELPDVRILSIQGFAGTGKTYVITQVLKWFVMMIQNQIAITAPTNKAVKVLRQIANFEHTLIRYSTIHKLLGLKEDRDDENGKLHFKRDYDNDAAINVIHSLVIDETSMLQDELFEMLYDEIDQKRKLQDNSVKEIGANSKGLDFLLSNMGKTSRAMVSVLKIIFMGDPLQIPPVGKKDCIPFNMETTDEYGIMTMYLTEIIRQKEGNPIIETASVLRQYHTSAYVPYIREAQVTSQGSVAFIAAEDKKTLLEVCDLYFSNARFAYDADFMKVICWTNKAVNGMNHRIRTLIYKDKLAEVKDAHPGVEGVMLPKILIGEKLIANNPITEERDFGTAVIFHTNDEFEVVDYEIKSVKVFSTYEVKVYATKVKSLDYGSMKNIVKVINILHEDYEISFNNMLAKMRRDILAMEKGERSQPWKMFFRLKEKFADVNYGYAITAHKSQGSTYENAIVIVADIDKSKKIEERNRIKYVAFTRARTNLFIVE